MSGIEITRRDLTAGELRGAAGKSRDAKAARRMLALALVLEGVDRTRAAETCGMDRQTLRGEKDQETVRGTVSQTNGHRYTAEGLAGLSDRWNGVRDPRLSPAQMAELGAWVGAGPHPARDGVVRWRRQDLQRRIATAFGIEVQERTVGKYLASPGHRSLSVRPQHPKSDPGAQAAFKKLPRSGSGGDPRGRAGQAARTLVPRVRHGAATGPRPMADARVGQQGTLTRVWARRGTRPRAPRDTRCQWASIFGAVCPARGAAAGLVLPTVTTQAMNAHLAELSRNVAAFVGKTIPRMVFFPPHPMPSSSPTAQAGTDRSPLLSPTTSPC